MSNRALALLVLAAMAGMALVTLLAALQTVEVRRAHDLGISKQQEVSIPLILKLAGNLWVIGLVLILLSIWHRSRSPAAARPRWLLGAAGIFAAAGLAFVFLSGTVRHRSSHSGEAHDDAAPFVARKPAELESLAYLPADSNLIAAIHVREALRSSLGEQLLQELRIGPLELGANHIEKWTGLKWEEIDELALALKIDGALVPRPTLVIQCVRPYRAESLLRKLHAERIPEAARSDCYRFQWGNASFKPTLWCPPEGRTLIITLTPADLEASLARSVQGIEHLPLALRTILRERMNMPAPLWAAVASEQWDATVVPQLLAGLPARNREALLKVRTVAVWLEVRDDITVNVAARCVDETAAADFASFLANWTKPALHDIRTVLNGPWVEGQAHGDRRSIQQVFAPPSGDSP